MLTPDQALQRLIQGNKDFLDDKPFTQALGRDHRLQLAAGQTPFAAYVSCSDSRVPPELLFGRGLGELFIVRNAGNVLGHVAMGSLEFAVSMLKVPLIVIMGHEACGAVKAAVAVVREGARLSSSIGKMIEPIIPAVLSVPDADRTDPCPAEIVRENVRRSVRELRHDAPPAILAAQAAGQLKVVGAYYELASGRVDFFDR